MGKPIGYHIGHRYATVTQTYIAIVFPNARTSRVAMTYVVALGASPMNECDINKRNKYNNRERTTTQPSRCDAISPYRIHIFHIYYFSFHILIPTLSIMKTKQIFLLLVALLGFAAQSVAQCTVSISLSNPELNCVNTTTTLTASSGFAAYQWSNGLGNGNTITVSHAGNYTVTATASNGCTAIATVSVMQNITPPNAAIAPPPVLTCSTPCVTIITGGVMSGVTYNWSNNTSGSSITICQSSTYTVTVTDSANGCTASATASVMQNITPPIALAGPDQTLRCNMPSVDIGIISPAPNVSYTWSVPYNTSYITVTSPGTYTVTVTDVSNGCTSTDEVMVLEDRVLPFVGISPPSTLTCANPTATLNAFSGANSVYTWSPNVAFSVGSNATINSPGTYTVTVTNTSNGCTASAVVFTSSDFNPPFVSMISSSTILTCATATATISASGASSYTWSIGGNTPSITVNQGGTYTVTATNMTNGCTSSASVIVTQDIAPPNLSVSFPTLICANSTATISASGGVVYQWSNNVSTSNGSTATVNQAGIYTVTATNANGCTGSTTFTIAQPQSISINVAQTSNVSCFGGANGGAVAISTGGTPPYTYTWDNVVFSIFNGNLTAGVHTVTVTDANICTAIASVTIAQPTPITTTATAMQDVFCFGGSNGSASAVASGGTQPYVYGWSNPMSSTGQTVNNLFAGIYTATATDASGCTAIASVTIMEPSTVSITASLNSPSTTCEGNGSVVLSSSGGSGGPYTYAMNNSNQQNSTIFDGLQGGAYTFLAFDAQGCSASIIVTVPENIPSPCVFPGDTNNDGIANNTDLLPIALSNALTGNARLNATTQWAAQTAQDWATNIPNTTTNRKHADCDGNGTILANDTLVILQNYGQVHQRGVMQTTNLNDPPISCLFANDTVQNTAFPYRLKANVVVGSAAIPAQGVHSLAFTINYDPTVASSAYINLANLSWLGAANELFHIQHDDGQGHLDVAISRFDGQSRNGAGIVAECGFVIIDNIIGRGTNSIAYPFDITVSDIKAINPQNVTLPMNGVATRTVLNNMVLATNTNPLSANIRISPNPTHDILNIQTNGIAINRLTLTNMLGQVLLTQNADVRATLVVAQTVATTLSLADLPQGTYFITIETPEGRLTQKVVKL
jgi:SprB repeat/Secretion system C-terminal sorting domain